MRTLLVTDTHGDLRRIETLIQASSADAVVHAGDFGFYDEGSPERMSDRELALRVSHSNLPHPIRESAKRLTRADLLDIIATRLPLSDLPLYAKGTFSWSKPVYAVWGNHEDADVLRRMREGKYSVPNLHLLDEERVHRLGNLRVFGVGGNVIPDDDEFFGPPLRGDGGKVWTTLAQFARLARAVRAHRSSWSEARAEVMVSHVSPGKQPLVQRFAAALHADFLISGHMGAPYACVWSEFAIREPDESERREQRLVQDLRERWERLRSRTDAPPMSDEQRADVEQALELLRAPLEKSSPRRGQTLADAETRAFRGLFFINLPDVVDGHAVLFDDNSGHLSLETHSKGLGRRRF